MVRVGADLGHGVALDTRLDRERVEAEGLRQHPGGLLVADGDVDPDQPVVAGEQLLQLPERMLLDAFIGHKANVHPAGHLLEAVIPAPVWRRRDHAGSAAGRSSQGLWWDQTRAASELVGARAGGDAGLQLMAPHQAKKTSATW